MPDGLIRTVYYTGNQRKYTLNARKICKNLQPLLSVQFLFRFVLDKFIIWWEESSFIAWDKYTSLLLDTPHHTEGWRENPNTKASFACRKNLTNHVFVAFSRDEFICWFKVIMNHSGRWNLSWFWLVHKGKSGREGTPPLVSTFVFN